MKLARHAKILEIIDKYEIETQEELAEHLRKANINITQATISRDIKELRLIKVLSKNGVYKYATLNNNDMQIPQKLKNIFAQSILSIKHANNLIVIKTIEGGAQSGAAAIDALKCKEIIGTIAGDDTILVVVQDNDSVEAVIDNFEKLMK
ncbi:MAG: arginine repressor [Mahellales bacterium]|jgi:transcriptional regulator of arginine metabolism